MSNFNQTMYSHYLGLFHNAKDLQAKQYARCRSNYYGRMLGMSELQLRDDKLPLVDFAALLGKTGSIAGDGDE